jgi:hypothetical protein
MALLTAVIRPMPFNPARQAAGDTSGLWRVLIYRRRADEDEELIEIRAQDLTHDQALELRERLSAQFCDRS